VGDVPEALLGWLERDLGGFLGVPCRILQPLTVPASSYDAKRKQHISTRILKALLDEAPREDGKLLGVVDLDLCIPILTFVFGEAQLGGVGAIVSLARLRQEFYGLDADERLFLDRLHKECLHELGHTYGLIHCHHPECIMYLSNTVLDVDRKARTMCRACSDILQARTKGG
jgi:archaemetzincin